jgi:hypothetical protein
MDRRRHHRLLNGSLPSPAQADPRFFFYGLFPLAGEESWITGRTLIAERRASD